MKKWERHGMSYPSMIADAVDEYVKENGSTSVMTRMEMLRVINEKHPEVIYPYFRPSDFCYNRIHDGVRFSRQRRLFEYLGRNSFRVLGTGYPYTGPIFHRAVNSGGKDIEVGRMEQGKMILNDGWANGCYCPQGSGR